MNNAIIFKDFKKDQNGAYDYSIPIIGDKFFVKTLENNLKNFLLHDKHLDTRILIHGSEGSGKTKLMHHLSEYSKKISDNVKIVSFYPLHEQVKNSEFLDINLNKQINELLKNPNSKYLIFENELTKKFNFNNYSHNRALNNFLKKDINNYFLISEIKNPRKIPDEIRKHFNHIHWKGIETIEERVRIIEEYSNKQNHVFNLEKNECEYLGELAHRHKLTGKKIYFKFLETANKWIKERKYSSDEIKNKFPLNIDYYALKEHFSYK